MNFTDTEIDNVVTMDGNGTLISDTSGNGTINETSIEDWPAWVNVGVPLMCVLIFTITLVIIYLLPSTPKSCETTLTATHDGKKGRVERSESVPLVHVHQYYGPNGGLSATDQRIDPTHLGGDTTGGRQQPKSALL